MKVPLSWIKDFVDITLPIEELASALTLAGLEVEEIRFVGLALPDHVQTIADFNIDHVTITINMLNAEIGEQIYPWIFYNHKRWKGRDAAQILHERQMEGLEMLAAKGILVKVNTSAPSSARRPVTCATPPSSARRASRASSSG